MTRIVDDRELPLGKRTKLYRFFEILPGFLTYSMLALVVILSIVQPLWAAIYILLVILAMFVRAIGVAYRTIHGHQALVAAQKVDWSQRLHDLVQAYRGKLPSHKADSRAFESRRHAAIVRAVVDRKLSIPNPESIYHAVIIAAYNESYDVIKPTIESVRATTYDNDKLIVYLAYEERMHRCSKHFKLLSIQKICPTRFLEKDQTLRTQVKNYKRGVTGNIFRMTM